MWAGVIGRDDSLERVDRFLSQLGSGSATLSIEGEPGIGKTTVWQAGVDGAFERGYRVLVSRPSEAETALAYSGVADLLANVDGGAFAALPEPQRHALEVALLVAEPTSQPPEPRAVYTALGAVLREIAREAPVLVAVDDQQWLDGASQRALRYVARRLARERVGVLTAARIRDAPGPPSALVGHLTLRLGPLSPAAVYRIAKSRLGVEFARPVVLRIHRATGGNPFFVMELARTLTETGLPLTGDSWPVPDDLRELVTSRIESLPDSARHVLLRAAASSRPTISGLTQSDFLLAERSGILSIGEYGQPRFAHPLYATALYSAAQPEERRGIHAALAAGELNVEERARHLALASSGKDEDVAQLLDRAAAKARDRGAPDVAAELAERSCALTPVDRPEQAWHRRATAAEYHFLAGDLARSRALLVELIAGAESARVRSKVLRLLGEACYRLGFVDDALRYLRQAVDEAGEDAGLVAAAEIAFAVALFYSGGSFDSGCAAVRRAVQAAEAFGDDSLLSDALAASAMAELLVGHGLDDKRLERALALEDPKSSKPVERRPTLLAGLAFVHAEQFDRARPLLSGLCDRLVERGEESDLPDVLTSLARLECLAGNLPEAAAYAERGFELARQAGNETHAASTRAMRALVHAHAGEVDETRTAAAEALDLANRSGWRFAASWATTALGLLEVSLANDAAVVETLAYSIELVERDGVIEPSRRPYLADAIEAFIRLGEIDRADRLTVGLETCGRALDRASTIVSCVRCRALLLAARGDVQSGLELVDRVLTEETRIPVPLELARTLIVKGTLQRRRKQRGAARDTLMLAVGICERIGATVWGERARVELARLGQMADPADLTTTEARVAELAAAGMTNREIAAKAFITQKTVEANLSRIYRKLGIRSRAELGVTLARREFLVKLGDGQRAGGHPSREPGDEPERELGGRATR